jgi:prevent-host-death family protein
VVDGVPTSEARERFDEIVASAERGETVILTRDGKPVAKLGPAEDPPAATRGIRRWGELEGQFTIPDDFDETSPEILKLFGIER